MTLISSIRKLLRVFRKDGDKDTFFYIRRYAREINYITSCLFLFNHLPLGAPLTYVVRG